MGGRRVHSQPVGPLRARPDPSWDPDAGKIKTIELSFTTDQAARINAMDTDAADMAFINIGESPNVAFLTDSGDYELHRLPALLQVALIFNVEREPFTELAARQAVKQAIDADLIGENLFSGDCAPASGIYPDVVWAHSDPDDPYPYDPDAAKQALVDAGLPDGFSFTTITNAGGGNNMASVAIQEQLSQVGIDMTVNPLPSTSLTPLVQAKDFDAQTTNLGGTADPSGVLVNSFINGVNVAGPEGAAELQVLVDQAKDPSLSQDERAEIFAQADQLIADNVWQVPICNAPIQWLTGTKVLNVDDMAWIGIFDPRYLAIAA